MKKNFYSKRLGKDFELEVCEPVPGQIKGDASDISIVRASALEELLYSLGGAVSWKWSEVEDKGIIFEISDDTGVHVAGTGDWDKHSLKDSISQSYPLATAWSRALAAAVSKYFGFEGRMYTDASFDVIKEPETPAKETITPETSADVSDASSKTEVKTPAKKSAPAKRTPVKKTAKSTSAKTAPGDMKWPFGAAKGMTLMEIAAVNDDDPRFSKVVPKEGYTKGVSYLLFMYEKNYLKDEDQKQLLADFLGDIVE